MWQVEFQPSVARRVAKLGIANPDFNPTIAEVLLELERDPKQFEKKSGKLAKMRAVELRYRNAVWRLVFTLDEKECVVICIALDKHDEAYRSAERRA